MTVNGRYEPGEWGAVNRFTRRDGELFLMATDRQAPKGAMDSLQGCALIILASGVALAAIILAIGWVVKR